ncbi:SIS domain-containing protein [Canibacter zhoujuaniae]|uniref:SIS domain-containing protein n=1 Tax=Canibacter zhoujuaniae TaxID=2708343 RepID=UPI0014240103|nr:sugar isomerase [Canibacter zhoujuaniae]
MNEQAKALGAWMDAELRTQPDNWQTAVDLVSKVNLPKKGERLAIIACGTPSFIGESYAKIREAAGFGETDSFLATEAKLDRPYDRVLAITRSGTTTEVLEAIERVRGRIPVTAIVGDPNTPIVDIVDELIPLPFADEQSVVQTRFATTALALLRAHTGENLDKAIADCAQVLSEEVDQDLVTAEQIAFLGRDWTIGLAHEAALKNREASQSWCESYSAMDYRHGPISIANKNRATWMLGVAPEGLRAQVEALDAKFIERPELDPMASLVATHMVAVERARHRGLDADKPRGLTRSIILEP